jgi:hypothetical protein
MKKIAPRINGPAVLVTESSNFNNKAAHQGHHHHRG